MEIKHDAIGWHDYCSTKPRFDGATTQIQRVSEEVNKTLSAGPLQEQGEWVTAIPQGLSVLPRRI